MSEHLQRLIGEIGPALDMEAVVQVVEAREWELVLAEGLALRLQYEASDDRLTFSGNVMALGAEPARDVLIAMLQYNAASTETGGVRLALDADLVAQLIYDTPVAALTLDAFRTIILSLAEKMVAWQGALAGDPKTQERSPPVEMGDAYLFRV